MSINSVYAQCPTVSNSNQSFCDLQSPTVANLIAINNGGGIVWYATSNSSAPLSSATGLINGQDYFADDSSGTCGVRQIVIVSIYSAPMGQNFQGVCVENANDATISDLVAVGNAVQWYSISSGGSPLLPSTVLNDNTIYYASQTNPNTGCETSRLSVFVNVGIVPVPIGAPIQEFCNDPTNPPTVASLVASGNNNWYLTPSSAAPLAMNTLLINGQSYYATTLDPPCESINRLEVLVNLIALNNPGTNGNRAICVNELSTTAPFNLYGLLGGSPNNTGVWSGPLPTSNGFQGTVNVSTLTLAGSPYTFTYTVSSGLCPNASSTVIITVLPLPTVTISVNTATVCSGNSATVTFTGTPNATVTYSVNNGSNQIIVLNGSGSATIVTTYTGTTTYTLIGIASSGTPSCNQSQSGSVTITVLPLPVVTITSNATICSGGSASVTFTGTPNATVTYTINGGNNQTIILSGSGTAAIVNTYAVTTTFTLVSVASATNPICSQLQTGNVVITVIQLPVVTISVNNSNVCINGSATVTFTGTANATVIYTVNGGSNQTIVLNGTGTASITNVFTVNTTYSLVSATTSGSPVCNQPQTGSITITILPLPVAAISVNNATVCQNGSATVTFTGTPNATVTYTINGGSNLTIVLNASGIATIPNTYSVTTTFTLVSVASSGTPSCSQPQTGTITITVIPPPVVTISVNNSNICSGGSATVTFTGTPNATVTYTINGGSNQTIILSASGTATIINTYTTTTTFTLVSSTTSGTPSCSQPQTGSTTITVIPPPTVTISVNNSNVCSGGSATITFTGTANATVTYTINGGSNQTIVLNASGTASITNTYTTSTTFTLVSIATSGTPSCSAPQTSSITISVIPPPTVTISVNNTNVCTGGSATVTFTGTPNATVTYNVNGGSNQTIILNASGTAIITTTYFVTTTFTLVSAATLGTPSCSNPQTATITISVIPQPTVIISVNNSTICPNDSATVTFTGTANATVNYTINGGSNQTIVLNAAGVATITNTYSVTTIFTLVSVVTSGTPSCTQSQTGSITISVIPPPTVTISVNNSNICPNGTATVTFTGTPNATVTFTINGGSNQTIVLNSSGTAAITNTYSNTTIFTLVSIVSASTPSCSQPISGSVTITIVPLPTVVINSDITICSGDTATVTFTGTPNATITYTVNNGSNQTIVLNASGTATISNTYSVTTTFTLVNASSTGNPSCNNPQTGSVIITVIPPPVVTISANNSTICPNDSAVVTFTGTPNATVTYTINGGSNQTIILNASGTATITNTYITTTIFTIVSVITAGTPSCSQPQTESITITVIPPPTVTITVDNSTICENGTATVTFTGTPNATVTYTINGGNNQTIVLNASGIAIIVGTYSATTIFAIVNVTTAGTPSCTQPQTASVTITVISPPTVTITSSTTICSGATATITFTGTPNATVTYTINGGSNQTIVLNASGIATIANTYTTSTTFTLVSVATSGTPGCSQQQTESVTITVLQLPVVTMTSNFNNVCPNGSATVTFTGTANATVTYTINGGSNLSIQLNASGVATILATYSVTTTYTIVNVVSSETPSCTNPQSSSLTITVIPFPTVTIAVDIAAICSGNAATITFTGTPNATVTYTVNGGINQNIVLNAAGTGTITGTYSANTTYTLVSVTTASVPTCTQLQNGSVVITVSQIPVAGNSTTTTLCENSLSIDLFTLLGSTAQSGGIWSPILSSGTGIFNPSIDLSGTYTYTVAGTSPCPNATATVSVVVNSIANAGNDASLIICSNNNAQDLFLLLGTSAQSGGTWSPVLTSGTGVFNPAVDVTGNYTYTVTGSTPCIDDTAVVNVTVTPGPEAGNDGSLVLCANSASQDLFNSLGGSPLAGGTWSPTLSSGSGIFNPAVDLAGIYTYTFFGSQPCDNDTANVTVTVNPVPDAGTNGAKIFCTNDLPQDLFASLGGTPQLGGTWSPILASGSGIFNPLLDTAGTYLYTVGGNLCATATATVVVTVFQSPNAGGIGATLLINTCLNVNSVNLFTGLNGTQANTGIWTDNDTTGALINNIFNPTITGAGTFHFTYTVGGGTAPCLFDTATVTVIVSPLPNAGTFSGLVSICPSVGVIDVATLLTGEQSNGVWTDVANIIITTPVTIIGFIAGTYSYTYTITNSCGTDDETVQFTILPNPSLISPNITISPVCVGVAATVNLAGMIDGTYTLNYDLTGSNTLSSQSVVVIITGGVGSFTIPPASLPNTGTTVITFTNILNNTSTCAVPLFSVAKSFVINPLADLAATNLTVANVCFGNAVTVVISGATDLPDGTYQFNYNIPQANPNSGTSSDVLITSGSGQFTIPASIFATAGAFTLTISGITTASGCANSNENAITTFTILPLPNVTGAIVSVANTCANFANQVIISGANNLPDGTYTLDYQLSGTNSATTSIQVTFTNGNTTFNIPAADIVNIGDTTLSITQLLSGTTLCGVSGTSFTPVIFSVLQLGLPQLNTDGNLFCGNDIPPPTIASLTANIVGTQNVVWYNAASNGTAYNATDLLINGTTYFATFTTDNGCESPTRLEVTVDLTVCDDLIIPDGFSPNNDGINDEFVIENLPILYPNFKLEIFNRYGNILYRGNKNTPNWEGTLTERGFNLGNNLLPTGVYFYVIDFNDGTRKSVQGRVYLSR